MRIEITHLGIIAATILHHGRLGACTRIARLVRLVPSEQYPEHDLERPEFDGRSGLGGLLETQIWKEVGRRNSYEVEQVAW